MIMQICPRLKIIYVKEPERLVQHFFALKLSLCNSQWPIVLSGGEETLKRIRFIHKPCRDTDVFL